LSVFQWTGQLPKVNEQQHQARENLIRALQSNDFVAILDSAMDEASKQLCVGLGVSQRLHHYLPYPYRYFGD
jgi:hypothetical protein